MIKNHILFNDISDWRFKLKKAEGSFIWDDQGHELIDFTSGWNVTNLGWNNFEISEAIIKQAKKNTYALLWSTDDTREEYASSLIAALPKQLNAVCRATGGTEANEEALKLARAATGRKKIIGFRDSYHGQSFGVMSLGYRPEYTKAIQPLLPDVMQIDFPSAYKSGKSEKETLADFLNKLESLLKKKDVAAIVTEAGIVTGWGSTAVAPQGFLAAIRKLTKTYGTLLILDEVGTGFSRCGKLFGMQIEDVIPDIATFAKGICNGAVPIGAMVTNDRLAGPTLSSTNLTSTFGWTPIACAAALATLKIHLRDKIWESANTKGNYLKAKLEQRLTNHPRVSDIRGIGLEIGVTFVKSKKSKEPDVNLCKKIVALSYKTGLHVVYGDEGNIQLMPPLTIPDSVLEKGIEIFVEAVNLASKN